MRQRPKWIAWRVRDKNEIRKKPVENSHWVQLHGNIYKQVKFLIFDEPIAEPVLVVSWESLAWVESLNVRMPLGQFLEFVSPPLKLVTTLTLLLHFPNANWQNTLFSSSSRCMRYLSRCISVWKGIFSTKLMKEENDWRNKECSSREEVLFDIAVSSSSSSKLGRI